MVNHLVLVSPGMSGYKSSGPEEEKMWEEFDARMKPQEDAVREGRAADAVEMDVITWGVCPDASQPRTNHADCNGQLPCPS
jgi:hypothetical protein